MVGRSGWLIHNHESKVVIKQFCPCLVRELDRLLKSINRVLDYFCGELIRSF